MSAKLPWAVAHLNGATVLTCGHRVAARAAVGDAVYGEDCRWPFEIHRAQELPAALLDSVPRGAET